MVVAANRIQRAALVATNYVGQNIAAIAALDAQYADYWAQDITAMSSYDASAAAAAGSASVDAALSGMSGSGAAVPAAIIPPIVPDDFTLLDEVVFLFTATNSTNSLTQVVANTIATMNKVGILPNLGAAAAVEDVPLGGVAASLGGTGLGAGLGEVSATFAHGGTIGSMPVPADWWASSSPAAASGQPGVPGLPRAGQPTAPGTEIPGMPGPPGSTAHRDGPPTGSRLTKRPPQPRKLSLDCAGAPCVRRHS